LVQQAFSAAITGGTSFMQMGRCNASQAQAGQFSLLELRSFPGTVAWANFSNGGADLFMPFASVAKEGHSDVPSVGVGGWRAPGRLERMQVLLQNGDVMAGSTVTVFGSV